MTNRDALYKRLTRRIVDGLGRWAQRAHGRRQLAQLDPRDLADARITQGDRIVELSKPFWRD